MSLFALLLVISCIGLLVRGCGACAQTIWLYKHGAMVSVLVWLLHATWLLSTSLF